MSMMEKAGLQSTNFMENLPAGVVGSFTVDVEDWFHILESGAAPKINRWGSLESRVEHGFNQILKLIDEHGIRATFFWLGWLAKRHSRLVTKCQQRGHEIASHGYAHMLPWQVGYKQFKRDISRAKKTLEDIIGEQVFGFRTAGFGIRDSSRWALDAVAEVGYEYDSSITPSLWGRNNISDFESGVFAIVTQNGLLIEIPMSTLKLLGFRLPIVGGGYLRLLPKCLIRRGINRLHKTGRPVIVYVHPRELDPDHPRLPLNLIRRFRCYFNLKSAMPKLKWLCESHSFCTMYELAENFKRSLPSAPSQLS